MTCKYKYASIDGERNIMKKEVTKETKKPASKKSVQVWLKFKSIVALTALTAGFIRAVYLEADNRIYVIGAGVLLSVLLLSCVMEVMFNKNSN